MLEEIRIQNFAIIDQLELRFDKGFNVITGETGAGKSIIIDAVELLIGGKADVGSVRSGADKATVEGIFMLNDYTHALVYPILESNDLLEDENSRYVTLSREVRSNGRSSGRINGTTVSNEILREVGEILVDIHGQSSHMSLFRPRMHIDLLDRYADLMEVREAFHAVVNTIGVIRTEVKHLTEDKQAIERRAEQLRYAIEEITTADLKPTEENDLVAERTRLANGEQIATLGGEIYGILNGDDEARDGAKPVVSQLAHVATLMSKLVKLDARLKDDNTLSQELAENVKELARTISNYVDDMEYNSDRLDEIEERIELIKRLKKRYNSDTIEALNAYALKCNEDLSNIENSTERLEQLREQEEKNLRHLGELGERISQVRKVAGTNLGKRIVRELKDLRMENTRFEVAHTRTEDPNGCYGRDGKRYAFYEHGIDAIEFMMSANPGEPLRPLAKVASGGEAARIMLALKRVLTQADSTPLLIFDEIDQGIGGRIGSVVGEKLWTLTQGHQVMCVTHLPQLAGFGDKHYKVQKLLKGERTATQIMELSADPQKVEELAQMLGTLGETGLQSAQELLNDARQRKAQLRNGKDAN
jgi:DNA repair protein RecN (Recombination protein N)